jgi:23S rRNA (uridine2552-2'-O)-methyltransferase
MYKKPDFYAEQAKKAGYPARSVFKLEELDGKYGLCLPGRNILDIGAAPGSWSLYCLRKIKENGSITAVDLQEIDEPELRRGGNVRLLRGDIADAAVKAELAELSPYDLVLSDAAPNTTGNKTADCGRSFTLVANIITFSLPLLREGGDLVVKVFQGGGEAELMQLLRPHFTKVKGMKPKASRNNSFETFYVGKGKVTPPSSS